MSENNKSDLGYFNIDFWGTTLESFDISQAGEIYDTFSLPSLKGLRSLVIGGVDRKAFDDEALINAITENLHLFECLSISKLSLHLSWVPKFVHLAHLRWLSWEVDDGLERKRLVPQLFALNHDVKLAQSFKTMLIDAGGKQGDELTVMIWVKVYPTIT